MSDLPDMTLRLGKSKKTGMGKKKYGRKEVIPLKAHSDKNLRGREEKVLKILRELVIQELHFATGRSHRSLCALELDHIRGRNATGSEPLGAIFDPLNLQLIDKDIHAAKTNALTSTGQRMDFRGTLEQETMTRLRRQILSKVGEVFTLAELRTAIESMVYHESETCKICGGEATE